IRLRLPAHGRSPAHRRSGHAALSRPRRERHPGRPTRHRKDDDQHRTRPEGHRSRPPRALYHRRRPGRRAFAGLRGEPARGEAQGLHEPEPAHHRRDRLSAARQAPEQSALPGDLAPLRTWQHHLDQQQRLQCLGRGLRRRPGDRKRHPRPPAPPLPRHQHPRRELPPQGEKAGRPLLPLAPAPGERRPSTRMNTGGGSVFHRQRWVIFRATLTVGDGALGFWAAVRDVWPETREQRCWVHRLANVLDKLPKRLQPRAKEALREIMNAESRKTAEKAIADFAEEYGAKYPKALESLTRDQDKLLSFFDFPAEHWKHLRTTNPIESAFATVRLRQRVTKGAGSRKRGLVFAYKLLDMAGQRWRRLDGA